MPLSEKAFPVSLDALKDMRDYVADVAVDLPIDKKKLYKLQLAVDEIATNITLYSGLTDEDAKILFEAEVREQSLLIRLKDRGIRFDPRSSLRQGEENMAKPVEERKIGGLGIYLALTGVDEFSYEYVDGWNVNQFEICFDKPF
jgi:anti-sigma regulatory factor (Ser/Thr protein kinase)